MASRARAERLASLALIVIAISCGRPQSVYQHAVATYERGDFAAAVKEAKAGAVRWNDARSPSYWDFSLLEAWALTTLARFPEAATILQQEPPPLAELRRQRVRVLVYRANLKRSLDQDPTDLLRQARQAGADGDLAIRIELIEGTRALDQDQDDSAQQFYRKALEMATAQSSLYFQAQALNNLSITSKRLNRYEESVDYGVRALAAAEKAGAKGVVSNAHGNLGPAYAYLGQFEAALDHEQQAARMHEAEGHRRALMTSLGELGLIYDDAERTPEAFPHYRRAFDLANQLGRNNDAERFAENLALAFIKTAQWDDAAQWNDRATDLAQISDAKVSLPYLARNRAEIAWGRGQLNDAARLCEELLRTNAREPSITWEAYDLLGKIHTAAKHYPEANRNFESALRIIDATRSDVLNPDNRITLLSRLIDFYRSYVDALVVQHDDWRALRVAESSRARVLGERLGRDLKTETFPNEAGLRSFARASNASILSFWTAPQRSFAWLVTAGGVRRFDLPPSAEIEKLVTDYRQVVEHSIVDPLQAPSARALWDKLMAPIAAEIPDGSHVIVIPDGPLHRLNLETLVAPGPAPHYWIENAELSVSPSMTIAMSKAAISRANGSVLVIGAPEYAGTGYDPLPGAASEVQQLRTRFSNVSPAVFTGAQASPGVYRAAGPEKFSVIHFAAHAEANVAKPLESAVVLSRGRDSFKLYARDVIDIPIHADLVTLSACRSAGARTYAGEGLMGFAWAFLQAGARAVVAGLWDVSDSSTGPLMSKFYDGIAEKRSVAAALRQAKLSLLKEGRYRKAFYWGAFQVYEGGIRATNEHE